MSERFGNGVEASGVENGGVSGIDGTIPAAGRSLHLRGGRLRLADEAAMSHYGRDIPQLEATVTATPIGSYTPIVRAGPWLITSGQLGAVDGVLVSGGFVAELEQALANVATLLATEGAGIEQVVKTTVLLRHLSDYARMNVSYAAFFGDVRPARTAFSVAELPLGALVEIEAWAYTG